MPAIKFNVNLRDFHKAHKDRKHADEKTIKDYATYQLILETMGDVLGDELLLKGKVHFPVSTWLFKVQKTKSHFVDRKASKEAGEKVIGFNDHSDGFRCFISAFITERLNKKKTFFKFKATRDLRRTKLNTLIRTNKSVIYNYETVR